jgi:GNAT superfamily N-acetyltransferase
VAETLHFVWGIRRLEPLHERASFDCGQPTLNDWLRRYASQYERRDLARTYVAVRPGESAVLGYYAISSHRVSCEALPEEQAKGLPTIDVPVVLLGRLAVDRSVQGRGLGEDLLIDALRRAEYLSQHVGIRAVEVVALDDRARGFYLKYGFVPLLDDPRHLFLPMQAVRRLGLPPL